MLGGQEEKLLYRYLNDGEPFLRIFLIPYTIDITGAMRADYFVAMLIEIAESFGKRLVEAFVWSNVLHA